MKQTTLHLKPFSTWAAARDHLVAWGWKQLNGPHGGWFNMNRPTFLRDISRTPEGRFEIVEFDISNAY